MKLLIGADFVPTDSNIDLFEKADTLQLFGEELNDIIQSADYRIFNLELPLTDEATPIKKNGPSLMAPTSAINGYCAAKVDLVTLANNHILDQGENGLRSTISTLEKAGISYVGVGESPDEASKPFIFEFAGKRVGVYACAEHEFSIVTEKSAGANPFDPLFSLDHIQELKKSVDFVIVLYHGGKEHYRYPSPMLQKVARRMIDKGADLVVCQHSHCIGCEEKYKGGTIVYGQGNFLFDHSKSEFWQTSLLIELDYDFNIKYIPLVKAGNLVRLAEGEKLQEILSDFESRCEDIKKAGFVEEAYTSYATLNGDYYRTILSGIRRGFIHKVINKLSGGKYEKQLVKKELAGSRSLTFKNFFMCEAHRELILRILDNI